MHIIALNRCWVIVWRWLLVTLTAVVLLLALALWQLTRAADKTLLLDRLQQLAHAGSISAQTLANLTPTQADGVTIATEAYWVAPAIWLLDNQMQQGKPGYDVIIPVRLPATGILILVNLGWLPAPRDRAQLPAVNIPAKFHIQGVVRTRLDGFRLGKNSEPREHWPVRIQQIDVQDLTNSLKQPLYAGIIYQQQNSPYVIHYQPVVMSPERHRAYALQWALLALAALVISLAASAKKIKLDAPNSSDKEVLDAGK